eukprot:EG_transcript_19731
MPLLPFLANPVARLRQLRAEHAEDQPDAPAEPSKHLRKKFGVDGPGASRGCTPDAVQRSPSIEVRPSSPCESGDSPEGDLDIHGGSFSVQRLVSMPALDLKGILRDQLCADPGDERQCRSAPPSPGPEEANQHKLPARHVKRRVGRRVVPEPIEVSALDESTTDRCQSAPNFNFDSAQCFHFPNPSFLADEFDWLPQPGTICTTSAEDRRTPTSSDPPTRFRRPAPQALTFVLRRRRPTPNAADLVGTRT